MRTIWQARKRIFGLSVNFNASQFSFSMNSQRETAPQQLANTSLFDRSKFDVYLLTRSGKKLRNVTANVKNINCWQSEFVPGQERLTFAGHTIKGAAHRNIYGIAFNGQQLSPLFKRGVQEGFAWSLDGQRAAWIASASSSFELMVSINGKPVRRLTRDRFKDQSPAFSPDGKSIVFVSRRGGAHQIFVIGADGTNLRQLTRTIRGNFSPKFSPDGRRIVFASDRDGTRSLYTMNSDGSAQKPLASTRGASYPVWK